MNVQALKIGLFIPCYIDQFYPNVGKATYKLLKKIGLEVDYPLAQTCCGQPMANSGNEKEAIRLYKNFVDCFKNYDYIVSPSGSCVYHIKEHYNIIEQTSAVQEVRKNIYELTAFLIDILKIQNFDITFPFKVGIHQSCHGLRGLKLGTTSELITQGTSKIHQLLEPLRGIEIINLNRKDECCGFGGTFSINMPDISVRMGEDRLKDHLQNGAEIITSTDMSCIMHLEGLARRQHQKIKFLHIAEILTSNS